MLLNFFVAIIASYRRRHQFYFYPEINVVMNELLFDRMKEIFPNTTREKEYIFTLFFPIPYKIFVFLLKETGLFAIKS
jgi:hypothetical protein